MPHSDETGAGRGIWRSELLWNLLVPVGIAGHILFFDVLPAGLAWAVSSSQGLDLFSGLDNPPLRRIAGLGLFLSALAAIITRESGTRLSRRFSVGHFLAGRVAIAAARCPSFARCHRTH